MCINTHYHSLTNILTNTHCLWQALEQRNYRWIIKWAKHIKEKTYHVLWLLNEHVGLGSRRLPLPPRGESLIVNSLPGIKRATQAFLKKQNKQKKNLHDPLLHSQLYLTLTVYSTCEMLQWMRRGEATEREGEREAHTDLSKYCFNYVVVENRAWSRGLGWQAHFSPLFLSFFACFSPPLSFSSCLPRLSILFPFLLSPSLHDSLRCSLCIPLQTCTLRKCDVNYTCYHGWNQDERPRSASVQVKLEGHRVNVKAAACTALNK